MSSLVETPFKLSMNEILLSSAITIILQKLEILEIPEKLLEETCLQPQYGFTASASLEEVGPQFVRITDIKEGTINWQTVPFCLCSDPKI